MTTAAYGPMLVSDVPVARAAGPAASTRLRSFVGGYLAERRVKRSFGQACLMAGPGEAARMIADLRPC